MTRKFFIAATFVTAALALGACDNEETTTPSEAPGKIEVTISGTDLAENGITADKFDDSWAVSFDKFLVSVGDIEIGQGHMDTKVVFESEDYQVFDLAKDSAGKGFSLVTVDVDGGHYDHYGYKIAPSADAKAANADQADVDALKAGGYAILIVGSATDGTDTKTFEWGFTASTLMDHCHGDADVDGNTAGVEFTVRADHLFFDSLVAAAPKMKFQPLDDADVANPADNAITESELRAVNLADLPAGTYDPGTLPATTLWDYIDQAASSMGMTNGDDACGLQMRE